MPLVRPAGAVVPAALATALALQAQTPSTPSAPAAPSRDSVYRLMLGPNPRLGHEPPYQGLPFASWLLPAGPGRRDRATPERLALQLEPHRALAVQKLQRQGHRGADPRLVQQRRDRVRRRVHLERRGPVRGPLQVPERPPVGHPGAPVVDLLAHPAPIEPYMGLPQDHPAGYAQASNLALAGRLQGKLLLVIGTSDVNVTFNHSMRLAQALIQAGKRFDLIVMPEEAHGLTPAAQAYYLEARARYFVEHLK